MTSYSSDTDDSERDDHQIQHERRLRTVKTIALGMAGLIVVGIGALGYGMYAKADRLGKSADAQGGVGAAVSAPLPAVSGLSVAAPVALPAAGLTVFGSIALEAPEGSEIVDVQTAGTVLTVTVLEPVGPSLHIIDLTAGRVLGRVTLKQMPGEAPVSAPAPHTPATQAPGSKKP